MEHFAQQKPKKKTWKDRLQPYIRQDEAGTHCHIVGDSVCRYVQQKLRMHNFLRHFRDKHEFEAKERGLLEEDSYEEEEEIEENQPLSELVENKVVAYSEVQTPTLNIFNSDGLRKDWYKRLVRPCILEDEKGAHCRIIDDPAACRYMQKTLRMQNFLRHFRRMHEEEARAKGLFWDEFKDYAVSNVQEDEQQKVQNESQEEEKTRRNCWYDVLKPYFLENEKGVFCQVVVGNDVCSYTQKTLRIHNMLRHFRTKHGQEAKQMGILEDDPEPSDADQSQDIHEKQLDEEMEPLKIEVQDSQLQDSWLGEGLAEQDTRMSNPDFISDDYLSPNENASQSSHKQRPKMKGKKGLRVMKFILQDQAGAHCRLLADGSCPYTQRTLRLQNFVRHFRVTHPVESGQNGLFWQSNKDRKAKELAAEASAQGSDDESANRNPSQRLSKTKPTKRGKKYARVMKFILEDQAGAHCRLLADGSCPYTQSTLRIHNFARHFRVTHPIESRQNGLCWRSNKDRQTKDLDAESSAQESDDEQERDEAMPVKTEEFNVVERGLAEVDNDGGGIRCSIEPESLCEYRQESYDEVRFLAHFRLKHSYLEDVLFPGDGATIPDEVDHVAVGEDGIFCRMEPDSGCDYFQTSYNEKKFRQHFREKHSDQDENVKPPEKLLYQRLTQFIYEDALGFHCRISGDAACDYVQQERQLQLFLRHFLLSHRKEAKQKGLLSFPQSLLKSILPAYESKGHIVIYQSYHLIKHRLVQIRDDGFRCSQATCDFLREKYDEDVFLEHLHQHHPALTVDLKPSRQRLMIKCSEHILQDERGFHCRIAGPAVCNYVQRRYRMQNFYRHFFVRHREDFDRAGFVLRHINSYGVAKVQDILANCGGDGEPRGAEKSNCDTLMDLELSVEQASSDEEKEKVSSIRHQPGLVPRVTKRQWRAQRATIEQLIKVNDEGAFCCNISEQSNCSFDMPNCVYPLFAKHFRTQHPEEAKRHGFFDELFLRKSSNAKTHTMIDELVALDEHGFRCNIDANSYCSYIRKRLDEKVFLKHFCRRHPEQAERHRIFDLVDNPRTRLRTAKRKKFLIEMVYENVMADSRGIHCRIADPLCDYVQEIFRAQNFQRHFIGKHPAEARAKGFLASRLLKSEPMEVEKDSTDVSEYDDEAWANPAEYCRLCSSSDNPLEPIFKHPDNVDNSLVTLIKNFTDIALTLESDNSAHICEKCFQQLKHSQHFRKQCQSFDRKVRRRKSAPDCSTSPLVVPFILDCPNVSLLGVESGDQQTLDTIKTEETVVEPMGLDPLVSESRSDVEQMAVDVENELPYARVANMLKCGHCERVCQSVASMMEHCQETHGGSLGLTG